LAQGGDLEVARQLEAALVWRLRGLSAEVLPLLQATGQRAAVQVVLLADGLQAQAAAQVLLEQATYLGTTAALASSTDSFAPHASSSASKPRFVKNVVRLALAPFRRRAWPTSGASRRYQFRPRTNSSL
jgi:hypothetical protein